MTNVEWAARKVNSELGISEGGGWLAPLILMGFVLLMWCCWVVRVTP
jgi:hypothetical protein